MRDQTAGFLSKSTGGQPIAVGTSAISLHDSGSGRVDDLVLVLVNITAAAVECTIAIAGGTGLVVSVPAKSQLPVGPFAVTGEVTATAAAGSSLYAIGSIRR